MEAPELLTVALLARELGITQGAVSRELKRLGIKPAARAGVVRVYRPGVLEEVRRARDYRETGMLNLEGGDNDVLSLGEVAGILGVPVGRVARVVGGGGVRPVCTAGGRPLLRRGQLGAIQDALAGKRPAGDGVACPGPGLVGRKPAGK